MILILSDELDTSTIHILQWLDCWNVPFFRINEEDSISIKKIKILNNGFFELVLCKNETVDFSIDAFRAFWYRRGAVHLKIKNNLNSIEDIDLKNKIRQHLEQESYTCEDYINFRINSLPRIGAYGTRRMNKLIVLHLASSLGLLIPSSIITTNKEVLYENDFIFENAIITKAISEGFFYISNQGLPTEERFVNYTEKISSSLEIPPKFFSSLLQTQISKEADIRIFYLKGHFFSMAIMSQNSKRTTVDFRKYDPNIPNRNFPIKVPSEITEKLETLMKKVDLETGSIDMILTTDGKFVFLEVNPVGQFNMVSVPCNYNLEKIFAQELVKLINPII